MAIAGHILRKFRASIEPVRDLKIREYVNLEYLVLISSECIFIYKLCVTFSDKYHWRVLVAYVILWINKASLVLYIAHMHIHVVQHATTDLKFGHCAVKFVSVCD
jgi:hypothetical protein